MDLPLASELLGHGPGARVLIVNCDDLGMHRDVNTAVIESIDRGIASSCSLIALGPWAPPAMGLLHERRDIPFGIHLTLVRDAPAVPWRPMAAPHRVPSLLDGSGRLFTSARRAELLSVARLEQVELEFRAQIDAVTSTGLAPTHLDFHSLADGGRDDILDMTVALAAEYGLAVRVWLDAGRRQLRQRGLPVVDHPFLDSFALGVDGKQARYVQLLRDLPAGLSEWAVHPSTGSPRTRAIDDGWRVRRTDYEFLISAEAPDIIRAEGIVVIDYRAIQQLWSRALRDADR